MFITTPRNQVIALDAFTGLDPQTGRPSYDHARQLRGGQTVSFCPSHWGGTPGTPPAYYPHTGYLYVGPSGADGAEVDDLGVAVCRHVGDSTRRLMDIQTDMSVLD